MLVSNLSSKHRVQIRNLFPKWVDCEVLGFGNDYPVFNTIEEAYDFYHAMGIATPLYIWVGNGRELGMGYNANKIPKEHHREPIKISCMLVRRESNLWCWRGSYSTGNVDNPFVDVSFGESKVQLSPTEEKEMLEFLDKFRNPCSEQPLEESELISVDYPKFLDE